MLHILLILEINLCNTTLFSDTIIYRTSCTYMLHWSGEHTVSLRLEINLCLSRCASLPCVIVILSTLIAGVTVTCHHINSLRKSANLLICIKRLTINLSVRPSCATRSPAVAIPSGQNWSAAVRTKVRVINLCGEVNWAFCRSLAFEEFYDSSGNRCLCSLKILYSRRGVVINTLCLREVDARILFLGLVDGSLQ